MAVTITVRHELPPEVAHLLSALSPNDVARILSFVIPLFTWVSRIEGKIDVLTLAQAANQKEIQVFMSLQTVRNDRLDAATTGIAKILKSLRDRLASGEPATVAELARYDEITTRLEGMGKDEADPLLEAPPQTV